MKRFDESPGHYALAWLRAAPAIVADAERVMGMVSGIRKIADQRTQLLQCSVRSATSPEKLDGYRRDRSRARGIEVPFPISCGNCFFCEREQFSLCENSNPNAGLAEKFWGHSPAGIFGYSHMLGGYARPTSSTT